jgi:isopenicillin N synthase-like dioxygenase
MPTLPTIALSDFTSAEEAVRRRCVERLGASFREYGFACIDDHGIPRGLIDRAFHWSDRLFGLPLEAKRAYIRPEIGRARGYTEYGRERAVGAEAFDLKEFWHLGQEPSAHPLAEGYPANVWPSEPLVEGMRTELIALYREFERTAALLLRAIALAVGLEERTLSSMIDGGNSVLRIIHYPPVPPDAPLAAVRAAAHEDINLITLLCEGTSGGLELLTRQGDWLPVSSLGGQLIINAGDMLTRLTGGEIPATTHRVVNPPDPRSSRTSIPFFTHPRPEVLLHPLCGPRAGLGEAVTANDFLMERLRANGVFDANPLEQIT